MEAPAQRFILEDEQASQAFAIQMAEALKKSKLWRQGLVVHLLGDLGAGKSFLVRGLIQAFAPEQKVKSPTYTLVESYSLSFDAQSFTVHHFDLYRLCDPEELAFLGVRDLLTPPFIAMIEWPQKGVDWTPEADLLIHLQPITVNEKVGRVLTMEGTTQQGVQLLSVLEETFA